MTGIYKSPEGERLIRERYLALLKHWPSPNRQFHVTTSQGDTFVIECGRAGAPPLLLLHGGAMNSSMWMGDVAKWALHFRIYAVDMIGEPGLSASSRPALNSDAYAVWLDDVLKALSIGRVSIVGISLGGWLALDYTTRRLGRVAALALLCPGGVGRQKIGIVFQTLFWRMFGAWGRRKLKERILGRAPENPSAAMRAFTEFVGLIHEHFHPRMVKMPVFSDAALQTLEMPVLAIAGGKDVLLDSDETRGRLVRNVPRVEMRYLPEAGHAITGQADGIRDFLLRT